MKGSQIGPLEQALMRAAARFAYPATPDVSRAVGQAITAAAPGRLRRGLLRAAAVLLLLLAAILATVPPARALLAGWFRIGVIQVVPGSPPAAGNIQAPTTATPELAPGSADRSASSPARQLGIAGETTLAQAEKEAGFHVLLPAYPPDLGDPDEVYYQAGLDLVIVLWLDAPGTPSQQLALYEFRSSNATARKVDPVLVTETAVEGHPALWLEGPYPLQVAGGQIEWLRIVEGRSLVWEADGITFRLESFLTLGESLRIAESLR